MRISILLPSAILWHSSNIIPGAPSALKEFYMTEEIK